MPKIDTLKKGPPLKSDWPSHYIVYRLREKGMTLRRLSRLNKFSPSAASLAIQLPWPKLEQLIATAIGVAPNEIWPSRYNDDGTPRTGLHSAKHNSAGMRVNVQTRKAA